MPKPCAIHPGEILREEFMLPLSLPAWRLARAESSLKIITPRQADLPAFYM